MIANFGLTWDQVIRDRTVSSWFLNHSQRFAMRARIRSLIDRFKPSRGEILKMAERAARSIVDDDGSSIDMPDLLSLPETFGLSEQESLLFTLEAIGVRLVRECLEGDRTVVPLARSLLAASGNSDALLAALRSLEMRSLAWESFVRAMKLNEFAEAKDLEFFGLDDEEMRAEATDTLLVLLKNGADGSVIEHLATAFNVRRDDLSPDVLASAVREGIAASLSGKRLGALVEFVRSQRVTPEMAAVNERCRQDVEALVREDIAAFLTMNDEERSVLNGLFGVSEQVLRSPDVAKNVEEQAVRMIEQSFVGLPALREIVPEIVGQDWYREACEKRVLKFIKGGQSRHNDTGLFMEKFCRLVGLPAETFRTQEIVAAARVCVVQLLNGERYESIPSLQDLFGVSAANGMKMSMYGGSPLPLYLFGGLIDRKTVDAWKVEGVSEAIAALQRGGMANQKSLTKYYANRRNFDGLAMAIELGAASVPYENESDAVRELQKLIVNGDGLAAEGLLKCYGLTGTLFDAGLRKRVKDAADEERQRREFREDFALDEDPHRVAEEMAGFYIDEWIGVELSALERRAAEQNVDLDFSTRMAAYNKREAIRASTEIQFDWTREYLVRSVLGEMRHQADATDLRRASFVRLPPIADDWLSTATNEEIRQMMAASADRFREPGWQDSYGSEPWARIAETAEMMFAPDPDHRKLIDLAYDLEHNSGTVFSKEHERVTYRSSDQLRRILGIKREVNDPEALLVLLESELSPEEYRAVADRWNAWKDVRARMHTRVGARPEERRARYLSDIRSLAASEIDELRIVSSLDRLEADALRARLTSEPVVAGRAGRLALMRSANAAIRKRIGQSDNGLSGVLERIGRPSWIGRAEVDFFAPIVGAYLKARMDVARDAAEMNAIQEILASRPNGRAVDSVLIVNAEEIPEDFRRLISELTKE